MDEPGPAMPVLPDELEAYRTVAFTDETVPAGLLRAHTTKAGVWARIEVQSGALMYRVRGGADGVFRLEPGDLGIVEPTVPHEVEPVGEGPTRFSVTFLRAGGEGR